MIDKIIKISNLYNSRFQNEQNCDRFVFYNLFGIKSKTSSVNSKLEKNKRYESNFERKSLWKFHKYYLWIKLPSVPNVLCIKTRYNISESNRLKFIFSFFFSFYQNGCLKNGKHFFENRLYILFEFKYIYICVWKPMSLIIR